MSISEALLPEYDQEMANTRKVLERIPDEKINWKAHPKSNTIGWVGSHLAEIPGWVAGTLASDSWDIAPPGGEPYQSPKLESRKAMLDLFDRNVAEGRAALKAASDADFHKSWSLLQGGQPIITMPKLAVMRTWVVNHTIHHRAHLCVYLRLNDVSVPGMYGPSADEAG